MEAYTATAADGTSHEIDLHQATPCLHGQHDPSTTVHHLHTETVTATVALANGVQPGQEAADHPTTADLCIPTARATSHCQPTTDGVPRPAQD